MVVLIALTYKGAALAEFSLKDLWRRGGIGGGSDTYTPSGAAALAVVLIALTYKGRTALQKLTHLMAQRCWR